MVGPFLRAFLEQILYHVGISIRRYTDTNDLKKGIACCIEVYKMDYLWSCIGLVILASLWNAYLEWRQVHMQPHPPN